MRKRVDSVHAMEVCCRTWDKVETPETTQRGGSKEILFYASCAELILETIFGCAPRARIRALFQSIATGLDARVIAAWQIGPSVAN